MNCKFLSKANINLQFQNACFYLAEKRDSDGEWKDSISLEQTVSNTVESDQGKLKVCYISCNCNIYCGP